MTYEGHSRTSNRVLIALVVITIVIVAFWAVSGGLDDIAVGQGQPVSVAE